MAIDRSDVDTARGSSVHFCRPSLLTADMESSLPTQCLRMWYTRSLTGLDASMDAGLVEPSR